MKKESIIYVLLQSCLIAVVFAAFAMLAGCKTMDVANNTSSDNSTIREQYDSTLTVAGDSATAALLLRCDSLGNVYLAQLQTEQGKHIRAELLLKGAQSQIDSLGNIKPEVVYRNQPMYIRLDCKEDSLNLVIKGLRERIEHYEKNDTQQTKYVKYVPDFYKNCTIGFLLFVLLFVLKIAAWVMEKIPATAPYVLIARKYVPFL